MRPSSQKKYGDFGKKGFPFSSGLKVRIIFSPLRTAVVFHDLFVLANVDRELLIKFDHLVFL